MKQTTLDDFPSKLDVEVWDWDDPEDVADYKWLEEIVKKAPNLWWDGWDGSDEHPLPPEKEKED